MTILQFDLLGELQPPTGMDRDAKVAYVLENWPECRDDDRELWLRFWRTFDGMDQVLGTETVERFAAWFSQATHPETIRRGRQEVQKLRTLAGSLLPSQNETERRRALDGAWPPRGRR